MKNKLPHSYLRKSVRKSAFILSALLVSGALIFIYSYFFSQKAGAAWFDENWLYRKAITVTVASSSSDISNLETLLTVDTTGITDKLQGSCQDLRFTSTSGKLLPYYIDSCSDNSATNKIWVEADLVPKNTTTYTMYMYYGNPSAIAGSDAQKFRLFNGLVGYWNMNESSGNLLDFSVNGLNTTAMTGTTATGGVYNNGRSFDGNDDTASVGNTSVLNPAVFTISIWVKKNSEPDNYDRIYEKMNYNPPSSSRGWEIDFDNTTPTRKTYASIYNTSGTQYVWTGNTLDVGTWRLITFTFNGTTGIYYENGVQVGVSRNISGTYGASTRGLFFGSSSDALSKSPVTLDDARYYNRDLSADEISQLYNNPGTIASNANTTAKPSTSFASEETGPGPVAYWSFDDGQGTTAQDSSSSNLDGTLNNTPTWTTADQCISDKCLYFDGTNNENVSLADDSKLDFGANTNFTVSAWVKRNGASSAINYIISKHDVTDDTEDGGYKLYMDASGDFCFGIDDDITWDPDVSACTSAIDFDDDKWHFVSGVRDQTGNDKIYLYVDGRERANTADSTTLTLANSNIFYIGVDRDGTSNEWLGYIDDVKVYPYARSAAQVKADYDSRGASSKQGASAVLGSQPQDYLSNGLVGYWKMNESSGNASDSSGNNTTLTDGSSTTYAAGKFGNGADLESTSTDYLYATDNTTLSLTGDLTLSGWVKPESTTADTQFNIAGKWEGANESYLLAQYGDEIRVYIDSSSNYVTTTAANLSTGTWYHVLGIYNSSTQTVKIYINGEEKATSTTGTIPSSVGDDASKFQIGGSNESGTLDLSPAVNGDDGHWWSAGGFDAASSTRYFGLNTSYYHMFIRFPNATVPNGATITTATLNLTAFQTDTSVNVPVNVYLNNVDNATAPTTFAQAEALALTDPVVWTIDSTWTAGQAYSPSDLASLVQSVTDRAGWSSGNALQVAIRAQTNSGSKVRRAATLEHATYDPPNLHIEYSQIQNSYDGIIDEVRLYNRALSSKEISDLYNFAPGPVGYWRMDDKVSGDSQTLVDTSGNANNATTVDGANNTGMNCQKSGKYGGACQFDGTDDYVSLPANLRSTDKSGAIEAWVYFKGSGSANTTSPIIDLGATATNNFVFALRRWEAASACGTNKLELRVYDGTINIDACGSTTLNNNTWYHLVVASSGSTYTMYVNGQAETITMSTGSNNGTWLSSLSFGQNTIPSIGKQVFNNADYSFSNGLIDDIKIYNYARTQKQIVSDMNADHPAVGSPVGSAVGYWDFDEGADNKCSGGTNDVCNQGSAGSTLDGAQSGMAVPATSTSGWTNSGKFGKALIFDGNNDYVDMGSNSALAPSGDMSLSAWIKTSSTPGADVAIAGKGGDSNAQYQLRMTSTGTLKFSHYNSSWYQATSTNAYNDGNWHHVIGINSNGTLYLYVDGKQVASASVTWGTASTGNFLIGARASATKDLYFTGTIDEVKVYSYALTADEVKVDYNRGQSMVLGAAGTNSTYEKQAANQEYCIPGDSTSCAAPVGEWKMEEKTGTSAFDTSGNGFTGTLGGDGSGTDLPAWTNGKVGGALSFDGSDDFVQITDNNTLDLTSTSFTLETWVKPNSLPTSGNLMSILEKYLHTDPWGGWDFRLYNNSGTQQLDFTYYDSNTTSKTTTYTGSLSTTQWSHLVAIHNSTTDTDTIYLNGVQVAQNTGRTLEIKGSTKNFTIGNFGSLSRYFNGKIDQVKIFNYARSATQVAWDYNKGAPVGYWDFDECQGTQVYDQSGNSITGTITIGSGGTQTSTTNMGTCTDSSASTPWYNGRTGKRNASLNFDGTDDYIQISSPSLPTTDFSYSFWVKTTDTDAQLLMASDGSGGNELWMKINGSSNLSVVTDGTTRINQSINIHDNAWNHIAITRGGGNIYLYVNGKAITNAADSSTLSFSTCPLMIGVDVDASCTGSLGEYLSGQIDDVKIFNYALTGTQVKNLYNNGAVFYGPSTGSP